MAVTGLRRYGHDDLADEIAGRWLDLARRSFEETGRVAETYDVRAGGETTDLGEYEPQYGVGWTDGVVTALSARQGARAGARTRRVAVLNAYPRRPTSIGYERRRRRRCRDPRRRRGRRGERERHGGGGRRGSER
ncbi:MAG: trehalase family glycosidase [Halorubrum sp.]